MDQDTEIVSAADQIVSSEIETLMRVEPSPAFLARVRERIGGEPAPGIWNLRQILGSAAALGVLAFVVSVTLFWESGQERPETRVSRAVATPAVEAPSVAGIPGAEAAFAPETHAATLGSAAALAARAPVITPKDELIAVRRLIAAANEGDFRFELASDALPVAERITDPGPIAVPLISLLPIGTDETP